VVCRLNLLSHQKQNKGMLSSQGTLHLHAVCSTSPTKWPTCRPSGS
jgi:hypothetical protein